MVHRQIVEWPSFEKELLILSCSTVCYVCIMSIGNFGCFPALISGHCLLFFTFNIELLVQSKRILMALNMAAIFVM